MASYSIIGLGKLGASMAAAIASRGFHVVGVDVDPRAAGLLLNGRPPVEEPGLQELLDANAERITATTDFAAIADTDVTFVVVPTPSEPSGSFSVDHARAAFADIGRALSDKEGYHLVVLTSTVLPGATRHALVPVLERASGRTVGESLGVCYSPEFIALGSVIRDFLNPDFTLIGESDARAGALLERCYGEIMGSGPPCRRMSLENAELTKVALNTYVTTKITFANMLADLCERIPGGDVDAVADALGLDRRIGRRYLTGATSYGGPCFPRDNHALGFLARSLGTRADLAEATDQMNRAAVHRLLERLGAVAGETVAVLGLAYKPDTPVVDESAGVALALELVRRGASVRAFDPLANGTAAAEVGSAVELSKSLTDAVRDATVVLVTTPDPAFEALRDTELAAGARLYDVWRRLPHLADSRRVRYIATGRGEEDLPNLERLSRLWAGTAEKT